MHYMGNRNRPPYPWNEIRRATTYTSLTGSGAYEPDTSRAFCRPALQQGNHYELDVWGERWAYDWPTWRAMPPVYLETRF